MFSGFTDFLAGQYPVISYLVVLIFSVRYYKKYFDTPLKYFPILVAYTLFNELLGYFIRHYESFAFSNTNITSNAIIYNIYDLIFYGFFFHFYWKIVEAQKSKRIIGVLGLITAIVYCISFIYKNPLTTSYYYATSIAAFALVITVCVYFTQKQSWSWKLEKYNLVTWISLGLFIFYLLFPFLFLTGYLNYDFWVENKLRTVLKVMIVIMNTFFCFGLVISRRRAFR